MIQIKRGKAATWKKLKTPLAAGQPGYDKDSHKLKIGDGETLWDKLPDATGIRSEEVLTSESIADELTIFTYGTKNPTSSTKGKVYLQQFDGAIETDYVVETGKNLNYFFRKWNSGFIECWGTGDIPSKVDDLLEKTIFKVKTNDYFEVKGFWK